MSTTYVKESADRSRQKQPAKKIDLPKPGIWAKTASTKEPVREVNLADIQTDPDQPRQYFDRKLLDELKQSIKDEGLIQPIVVTPNGDDSFRLIAGERRYRVMKELRWKAAPSVIKQGLTEQQLRDIQLNENIVRAELDPVEASDALAKYMKDFKLTVRDMGKKRGLSTSTVGELVSLQKVPRPLLETARKKKVAMRQLVEVARCKTEPQMADLLDQIINFGLSVRAAKQQRTGSTKKTKSRARRFKRDYMVGRTKMTLIVERDPDRVDPIECLRKLGPVIRKDEKERRQ